jgi:hypothetical protein
MLEPLNSSEPNRPVKWIGLQVLGSADIVLVNGLLNWQLRLDNYHSIRPPKGLLARFIGLHDKNERAYLRFAQRCGVLALCQHGLPATHARSCSSTQHEPVEQWRALAKQAHAIMRLRDAINRRERTDPADWNLALSVCANLGSEWEWARRLTAQVPPPRDYKYYHQNELGLCVQGWLDAAHISPWIRWNAQEKQYQITLMPSKFWEPNRFAHLAMEWKCIRS